MTADPVRSFVGTKIARYERVVVQAPDRRGRLRKKVSYRQTQAGWTPLDVLAWASDRDAVGVFRDCVMLVRLCNDEQARRMPEHQAIHAALGFRECCGPALLAQTAQALGIPDERARHLVAQLDAEDHYRTALVGGD